MELSFEYECSTPFSIQYVKSTLGDKTAYVLLEYFYNKIDTYEFYRVSVQSICIHTKNEYIDNKSFYKKSPQGQWANKFQVIINNDKKNIKFGPTGNIILKDKEFRSFGIGTYCMSKLIEILQLRFPDYKVLNGELGSGDATPDNKYRRNSFYNNLFEYINFSDESNAIGKFGAKTVSNLKRHTSSRVKLEEFDYIEHLKNNFDLEKKINKQEEKIKLMLERNKNNDNEIYKLQKFKYITVTIVAFAIISFIFLSLY